jgi:ubiquinone/menaquinone biosynthesis C-methylase UbiE
MGADRDDPMVRATSFAAVADVYERARPGYPREAVEWLTGPPPLDVVDLGAGTGKLTQRVLELGHRVTAVEPLPEMLDRLRAAVPDASAVLGTAEVIPLADDSADVVTVAQAFHWFDHGPALEEIARVLRPGGHLALVWNTRDEREPWVAKLSETVGSEDASGVERYVPILEARGFGHVERATFEHAQRLTRESLRDLVLSRSYCAVRTPEERVPILESVDALFDAHAVGDEIELPYVTACFRAVRSES